VNAWLKSNKLAIVHTKWNNFINRNTWRYLLICIFGLNLVGCTSTALKQNTLYQSRTVGDLLAEQVIYNLEVYHEYFYYRKNNFNSLPSFVKVASGTAQTQRTVTGSFAASIPAPTSSSTLTPTIGATAQTQDSWGLLPVVDLVTIKRLHNLYETLFTYVPETNFANLFPRQPLQVDASGHPFLHYEPQTNKDGTVKTSKDGLPQYVITVKLNPQLTKAKVPGALNKNMCKNKQWFTFDSCVAAKCPDATRVRYLNYPDVWILNADDFYKFALLTLGDDDPSGQQGAVPLQMSGATIQSGFVIPYK
jgi:hypothetical protein